MDIKDSKKYFFLFFILSFLITVPIISSGAALIPEDNATVNESWIDVSLTDPNPNDKLKFNVGGEDLTKFESLGLYAKNPEANELVYASKATIGFETNIYTDVNVFDVCPDLNPDADVTYQTFREQNNYGALYQGDQEFYVTFSTIDLGNTFNRHDYSQEFPISVNLHPDFESFDGETINGITIQTNEYKYETKTVEVSTIEEGLCGSYQDNYTGSQTFEQEIEVTASADDMNVDEYQNVADKCGGEVIEGSTRTLTVQNYITETTNIEGHNFNENTEDQKLGKFTFNDQARIRPSVMKKKQSIRVTAASILDQTDWTDWDQIYWGPNTYTSPTTTEFGDELNDVIKSVHVQNRYIHKEYTAQMFIFSTVQLDAETFETALEDPYFQQGNFVWDERISGTEKGTVTEPRSPLVKLFESLGNTISNAIGAFFGGLFSGPAGIIILIVIVIAAIIGIYLFIKIGLPILRRYIGFYTGGAVDEKKNKRK